VPIGTSEDFKGVWASSPSDVWVIGATTRHWDGNAWQAIGPGGDCIWGSGPDDVWTASMAKADLYHWDGSVWTAPAALGAALLGTWGSSSTDLWVVGEYTAREPPPHSFIAHWDGTSLGQRSGLSSGFLNGVWGTGADDVWAVGETVWHWDGSVWSEYTPVDSDYSTANLSAVWQDYFGESWAVGSPDTILHHQLTGWTKVATGRIPAPSFSGNLGEQCRARCLGRGQRRLDDSLGREGMDAACSPGRPVRGTLGK